MGEKKIDFSKRKTLTFLEVEEVYGYSPETLIKWTKRDGVDGKPPLKAFKPGKEWTVYVTEMDEYIKRFPADA